MRRRHPLLAVAHKDALDLLLNKSTLGVLVLPILLSLLLALLSHLVGSPTSDLLVYNPSGSAVEHVLTNTFSDARLVHAHAAQEVAAAFDPAGVRPSTPYIVGLVVPTDYEAALRAGHRPVVVLYLNGEAVSSQQGQRILNAITLYGYQLLSPQGPATVTTIMIHPPPAPKTGKTRLTAFFTMLAVLSSMVVGITLLPHLLVEEKERKTLWMLLVSPARLSDIVGGKLLVGMGYQVLLAFVVLAVQQGFRGQVGCVLLFVLLGSALSSMLGLLVGSLLRTMSASGALTGLVALVYLVPGLFAGPLEAAFRASPLVQALEVLPTHYLAQGLLDALQNQGTLGGLLLDASILLFCTLGPFALAVWVLRRQASVLSTL